MAARSWDLGVEEISGLGVRRDPRSGSAEVIAVSDRSATIVAIRADGSDRLPADERGRRAARHHQVRGLPGGADGRRGDGSQWEAVAGDAEGRVIVLRERGSELLVLSPDLRYERRIALRHEWEDDRNAGLESLVLLRGGHVLSAKQRHPMRLLEFGPTGDDPTGPTPSTVLPPGEPVHLAAASELHCLGSWEIAGTTVDGDEVDGINDLAAHDGALYLISSRSRGIGRMRLSSAPDRPVEVDCWWPLPAGVADGPDEKAEGLVVDARLGVLVGVDSHEKRRDTLHLLDGGPLSRGGPSGTG